MDKVITKNYTEQSVSFMGGFTIRDSKVTGEIKTVDKKLAELIINDLDLTKNNWEEVKNNKEGELVKHTIGYELHKGTKIIYYPPFQKCDRVEDYKRAWTHFEKVFTDKQ